MPETVVWGGLELPESYGLNHFMVAGATGSGKTVLMDLLLRSVLSSVAPGRDTRVVIYDAKGEAYSKLRKLGAKCPVHLIQPFDARGTAWDIAKDARRPEDIQAISSLLFPVNPRANNPFFEEAAGALFQGVLTSLNHVAPGSWTLRDALLAVTSKRTLREVLALAPQANARRLDLYFGRPATTDDVMATVATRIERYEVVAAYWEKAKNRISLDAWAKSDSVLILGDSHRSPESVRAINQAMFRRLSQVLLDRPTSNTRRTWFFLDELSKAGRLDGLDDLLTKGRQYGACLVLGFQDIAGLEAVYGEKIVQELTAQVAHVAVLRLGHQKTAKWAEGIFGHEEIIRLQRSESLGVAGERSNRTHSVSEQHAVSPVFMDSLFLAIPPLSPPKVKTLGGFYRTMGVGCYAWNLPIDEVRRALGNPDPEKGDHRLDLPEGGHLRPWTESERRAFRLPPEARGGDVDLDTENPTDRAKPPRLPSDGELPYWS